MINKAIIMGRLTRDPEIRYTQNNTPVCSFSVAVDNGYGDNRRTDFINCVAWRNTAEFVSKYFSKGKMIIVIGRIQTRTWDGQDGKKNYATEIVANEVSFGETKKSAEGGQGEYAPAFPQGGGLNESPMPEMPAGTNNDDFTILDTEDDLPF